MASEMKHACDFVFGFLQYTLPMDTIGVELMVRMVKGIHMFRQDHMTEAATYRPWIRWMKPFPSLQKKIKAYKEKRNENSPFLPNPSSSQKSIPNKRSRERCNRRSNWRKLDMGCFSPPKVRRPANLWAPLPATKSTTTAKTTTTMTMANNTRIAITSPTMSSTCRCARDGSHLFPLVPNQPLHPSPQESD